MANSWFRFYAEFEDDPKVQMLPEHMQRRLAMLFCERCKEEKRTDAQRAFKWGISLSNLSETKSLFIENGFIDDKWNLTNWNKRQFLSDSSTDRVRKYRASKAMKQDETLHVVTVKQSVTSPDTDTDTEQKHKKIISRSALEEIYQAYPKKVGKEAALKAIEKAVRSNGHDAAWFLERVKVYAREREGEDPQYTPHPATWFNRGSYLDELEPKFQPKDIYQKFLEEA